MSTTLKVEGSRKPVRDSFYPYDNINMTRENAEITFEAVPGKGQMFMTTAFIVNYLLRAVFRSKFGTEYEPVYNKGIRYKDGSYIKDKDYGYTDTIQYAGVYLHVLQNGSIAHKQVRIIPVNSLGAGMTRFILCLELDDDSPIKIRFRIPLSNYIYCNRQRELEKIEYSLEVQHGTIRFSDSNEIFDTFNTVTSVEHIKADNSGNIDLEEIQDDYISNLFVSTEP